jgi:hypothetical protein
MLVLVMRLLKSIGCIVGITSTLIVTLFLSTVLYCYFFPCGYRGKCSMCKQRDK